MVIFDDEDCAIILSEEMNFDQVFKIKFIPAILMDQIIQGQTQTLSQDESL